MAVEVRNFGCRLNIHEGEVARRKAEEAGLSSLLGGAIVVNTCAVTGEAVRQAKQAIRKARREKPDARIIVTGCAAQINPQDFAEMGEVDLVIGNDDKLNAQSYRALPEFGVNQFEKVRVNDIFSVTENAPHMVNSIDGHTRAFVQVQNGCDHRCTFCIIPFGRGKSRSVPMGGVVEQIRLLVDNGYQEVVLTGVDLTSYGPDLPGSPTLGQLVKAILRAVPQLPRLRLSSIDSIEADDSLFDAIASEERLMPHFHLSLQHGDDLILKRMKRRHLRADAIDFCKKVRSLRPEAAFSGDMIAGFPTEDEGMFQNTLSIVDACGLSTLHVFPFSARPGTPAAKMPQLDRSIIKERAARLREKSATAWLGHLARHVGQVCEILTERGGVGRTADFTPVSLEATPVLDPGVLVNALVKDHDGERLIARPQVAVRRYQEAAQ